MWPNSPATNQSMQFDTGTVIEYVRDRDVHQVRLDRGLVIEARALDLGVLRAIRRDQKVVVFRAPTMQWAILGSLPVPNKHVSGDPEIDDLYARQPDSAPEGEATYRLPGREVLGPDDKEIEARSDTSFARMLLFSAGGVVSEAGKFCFRYMNGIRRRITEFCYHFLVKIPGITVSAKTDDENKTAQTSISIKPSLTQGVSETNNLKLVMGADAINAADTAPNVTQKGQGGELESASSGNPGIGLELGEFIKMLASAQSGKVRVAVGEANSVEIDTTQLLAQITEAQIQMSSEGITLQTGEETITLGLSELLLTVSALTMTITGAANITASTIALNGTTTIENYRFLVDLINKLNEEWVTVFNGHIHTAGPIPTTGPSGAFTPIVPTGAGT